MSTHGAPLPPPPRTSAPRGARRVVSIALVVVLVGTGLLAAQACSSTPGPVPPAPSGQPSAAPPVMVT